MDNLERALSLIGELVVKRAKENIVENNTVDTGELLNSITYRVEGNSVIIGTPLEYAPYVEYGTGLFAVNGDGRKDVPWRYQDAQGNWHSTSGMTPSPYLVPALHSCKGEIKQILGNSAVAIMEDGYAGHKHTTNI